LEEKNMKLQQSADAALNQSKSVAVEMEKVAKRNNLLEQISRELKLREEHSKAEIALREEQLEQKRVSIQTQMDKTMNDIREKVDDSSKHNQALSDENNRLRTTLQDIGPKIELMQKSLQATDLEKQLFHAKLEEAQHKEEAYLKHTEMLTTENEKLRSSLTELSGSFGTFQESIGRSNELLEHYKKEIGEQSKLIKQLRKDNDDLRAKSSKTDLAFIKMHEDSVAQTAEVAALKKDKAALTAKVGTLETLCRTLNDKLKGNPPGDVETSSTD
jgi:chromosome segregation ATPase